MMDLSKKEVRENLNKIMNEVMYADYQSRDITPFQIAKKKLVSSRLDTTYEYIQILVEMGNLRIVERDNRKFLEIVLKED